jgi:hypothetical protein
VILATISDSIGMIPTFRKAYHFPHEENLPSFAMGLIYYLLALLALNNFTVTTWLFSATVFVSDAILVVIILTRRKN